MANYLATDAELTSVANKIRSKTGSSASLEWPDGFVSGINSISGGGSPTLQTITKSYTPTESQQTETITAGTGYDGIGEVDVTVGAISSSYVGSGVARKSSSDLTASDLTVTAPAGYYASSAAKTLSDANLVAGNVKKDVQIFGVTGTYEGGGSGTTVATGTVTPTARTLTISFDAGKTGVTNVLVLPTSETPLLSNGRTSYYFVGSSNTYLKGIRGGSNSGGSGTGNPSYSTTDDYFSQSGTTITITLTSSSGGYWETISYTWWAW